MVKTKPKIFWILIAVAILASLTLVGGIVYEYYHENKKEKVAKVESARSIIEGCMVRSSGNIDSKNMLLDVLLNEANPRLLGYNSEGEFSSSRLIYDENWSLGKMELSTQNLFCNDENQINCILSKEKAIDSIFFQSKAGIFNISNKSIAIKKDHEKWLVSPSIGICDHPISKEDRIASHQTPTNNNFIVYSKKSNHLAKFSYKEISTSNLRYSYSQPQFLYSYIDNTFLPTICSNKNRGDIIEDLQIFDRNLYVKKSGYGSEIINKHPILNNGIGNLANTISSKDLGYRIHDFRLIDKNHLLINSKNFFRSGGILLVYSFNTGIIETLPYRGKLYWVEGGSNKPLVYISSQNQLLEPKNNGLKDLSSVNLGRARDLKWFKVGENQFLIIDSLSNNRLRYHHLDCGAS